MKNEAKIIELLSESLKRQDQQAEEMKSMKEDIKSVKEDIKSMRTETNDNFHRLIKAISDLADVVKENSKGTERIEEHERRIFQLEKHTGIK